MKKETNHSVILKAFITILIDRRLSGFHCTKKIKNTPEKTGKSANIMWAG